MGSTECEVELIIGTLRIKTTQKKFESRCEVSPFKKGPLHTNLAVVNSDSTVKDMCTGLSFISFLLNTAVDLDLGSKKSS